jgi:RHS repeat-associated protein
VHKFTGKQRDAESNLDNFEARYYASALGRFMRPDDPLADQDPDNPQSWNLYTYVRNNPLNNTDPSGNACVSNGNGGWKDDDSGGQTCAEANDPKNNNTPSAVVTAKGGWRTLPRGTGVSPCTIKTRGGAESFGV